MDGLMRGSSTLMRLMFQSVFVVEAKVPNLIRRNDTTKKYLSTLQGIYTLNCVRKPELRNSNPGPSYCKASVLPN